MERNDEEANSEFQRMMGGIEIGLEEVEEEWGRVKRKVKEAVEWVERGREV